MAIAPKLQGAMQPFGFGPVFPERVSLGAANLNWTPLQLGALLKGWYQGDRLSSINGAAVTRWNDDSGSGNTAATISHDPPLALQNLNRLNVVQFVAASTQGLQLPTGFTSAFTEGSVFFVAKVATVATGSPVQGFGTSGLGTHYPFSDNHVYSDFLSTARSDTGIPSGLTSWHIGSFQSKTNDWRYAINGVDFYTTGTNTVAGSPNVTFLGSNNGVYNYDGNIAEIVLCNSFLTTIQRQLVEGYLAWKWGLQANLSGGHPYAASPPILGTIPYTVGLQTASTPVPVLARSIGKSLATTSAPVPVLARAVGKPLATASIPVPTLVRSTNKPLATTSTPVPTLTRAKQTVKSLLTTSTPVPTLVRSTGKPLSTTSTPMPTLTRAMSKSLLTATTPSPTLLRAMAKALNTASAPVPTLVRSAAKNLQGSSTPLPTLAKGLAYTKALQGQSTPVPTLVRAVSKPLQTSSTPVPKIVRLTSKMMQGASTPVPTLAVSRQYSKSLQAITTPVPTLTKIRVFVKNLQASTGGVTAGGVGGVKVAAFFS